MAHWVQNLLKKSYKLMVCNLWWHWISQTLSVWTPSGFMLYTRYSADNFNLFLSISSSVWIFIHICLSNVRPDISVLSYMFNHFTLVRDGVLTQYLIPWLPISYYVVYSLDLNCICSGWTDRWRWADLHWTFTNKVQMKWMTLQLDI